MPCPFTLERSKRRGKSRRKTSKKKVVNQPGTVAVNEQDKLTPLQVVSQLGEPPILCNDSQLCSEVAIFPPGIYKSVNPLLLL